MSKVTYPKGSQNPSKSVGEQSTTDWPEGSKTDYPGGGPSATVFNGHKSRTLHCSGGSGGKTAFDYPQKLHQTGFGMVKSQGKK